MDQSVGQAVASGMTAASASGRFRGQAHSGPVDDQLQPRRVPSVPRGGPAENTGMRRGQALPVAGVSGGSPGLMGPVPMNSPGTASSSSSSAPKTVAPRAASSRPARPSAGSQGPAMGRPQFNLDDFGRVVSTALAPGSCEILPMRWPGSNWTVCAYQAMGDRKTQEDRFCVAPSLELDGRTECAFFGVFDGTVGDFASENVKELVLPKLLESASWRALRQAWGRPGDQEGKDKMVEQTLRDMYRTVDESLLARCARNTQHYATCTSVTLLLVGDVLAVGHLGDSRIILGKDHWEPGQSTPTLVGEQLTLDHKPDQEVERMRIEKCGGMVERLQNHNNKPFIRGGDFLMRKALGEQPMQLQYSRAFGAKDLKIFGLSSVPDVKLIRMSRDPAYKHVRFLILASDGLWDVMPTQQAVVLAQHAYSQDLNPAEALVRQAILEVSRRKGRADNITAVVIQCDPHP